MQINLEEKDVTAACSRGLAWLNSDMKVPAGWTEDLFGLKVLLSSLLRGSYKLVPVDPPEGSQARELIPGDTE